MGHLWHANIADNDIGILPNDQLVEAYLRAAGVALWVGTTALLPSRDVLLGSDVITAQDTVSQVSEALLDEMISRGEQMQPPVHQIMGLVLGAYPQLGDPTILQKSGLTIPGVAEAV